MHSYVRPNQYVAFRLPSDATKILKVVPDTYDRYSLTALFVVSGMVVC